MKLKLLSLALTLIMIIGCAYGCKAAGDYNGATNDNMAMIPGAPEGALDGNEPTNPDYEYDEVIENGFISPTENANSTFSLDRNTASYTFARKILNMNAKVSQNSVRIEEYVNYFNYDYQRPTDEALAITTTLSACPWNSQSNLLTIGISAQEIEFSQRKRNNLVFLIDVSGSMYGDDRLGLVQQAFCMLTENLADDDIVSVVTYASGVRVAAEGMLGANKTQIANVLHDLQAGGSTAGAGGIQLAYQTAEKYFIEGGNNRVILATDGDFNVGIRNKNDLNEFISSKRNLGVWLSVLGVGMYNTSDVTMKTLAENGNGNYGYLDSVEEARKLLVTEMGGTLVTVAKDCKINVTFNSEAVNKYRLIGYETKMMSVEDFENYEKDAGEIGSGHTVTAVYEVVLNENAQGIVADIEIRYKDPESEEQKNTFAQVTTQLLNEEANEDTVFIGCVTEFGLILRNSEYKGDASFNSVIARLSGLQCVVGEYKDDFKAEFLTLVQKAKTIYSVD
ncbi:MAG: von Willebrand factor type A domain-containing protein [Clostridia bacterium]|nr:von Willebrand factor type A domain-containing protein [Clostridia bacterium]